jgi:hypothetical protein
MTRCSYCATYAGQARCDNCGAPKAPDRLSGRPGSTLTFSAPLAYSDLVVEGNYYSMHPDHMPETLRVFLEARERAAEIYAGLVPPFSGIEP